MKLLETVSFLVDASQRSPGISMAEGSMLTEIVFVSLFTGPGDVFHVNFLGNKILGLSENLAIA